MNVWCDWNRDGDWDDILVCPDGTEVPEWAVQNHKPALPGAGTCSFTTPAFMCWHPTGQTEEPLWLRLTISEQPQLPTFVLPDSPSGLVGTGPRDGYQYGETEDYYIRPQAEPMPGKYDWGDAPDGVGAPGYPTLAANSGARHVPVGPWLGDDKDRPDSEADGQPHPDALGDDIGGINDENGVSIPLLIVGHWAAATIQVNGGGGIVQGWIDFNGDEIWQPGEQMYEGFLPDGIHILPFDVPAGAGRCWCSASIRRRTRAEAIVSMRCWPSTAMQVDFDSATFAVGGWLHSYEALSHPATAGIADDENRFGVVIGASVIPRWPARPVLVGRWGWPDYGDDASPRAMMGNDRYDAGEKLGDLVLVAEQPVGKGRIVAFGDTSGLTNAINVSSHVFTARLFAYGRDDRPAILMRHYGKGIVFLIGDPCFAMNKNLEYENGEPFEGLRENADFWRWLLSILRGGQMWIPPILEGGRVGEPAGEVEP